ncbi:hypothetical protein PR202_gb12744 [Eleusine coracana subsp. coracana]|uniref:Amino acid transporter transmembrane domain-containing protein n=1 Tax=Eleusine coracana subsp. coracana TaxID=191504 RepID=A0AAV5EQQ8_ELECO|nr:hypothetical protein PR202_gb12744 [Eleusine coracana subsp. coracana]
MALPSGGGGRPAAQPLLLAEEGGRRGAVGGATPAQTLGNVVVSIVGTGVLGLPYAFRAAGWLAGSLGVVAAGLATLYCMLLLVSTQAPLCSSFPCSDDVFCLLSLCPFLSALFPFTTLAIIHHSSRTGKWEPVVIAEILHSERMRVSHPPDWN